MDVVVTSLSGWRILVQAGGARELRHSFPYYYSLLTLTLLTHSLTLLTAGNFEVCEREFICGVEGFL